MGTIVVTKTKTVPPCPDQTCNNVFVKAVSSPPTLTGGAGADICTGVCYVHGLVVSTLAVASPRLLMDVILPVFWAGCCRSCMLRLQPSSQFGSMPSNLWHATTTTTAYYITHICFFFVEILAHSRVLVMYWSTLRMCSTAVCRGGDQDRQSLSKAMMARWVWNNSSSHNKTAIIRSCKCYNWKLIYPIKEQ